MSVRLCVTLSCLTAFAGLKEMASQYKRALWSKREDLQKVLAQVKEIPLTEALGEKAKALKTDVQNLESSVKAVTERFQVCYNQLKQKGADLTGLAIQAVYP
jgi:predicted  nucleic acid-binding Zn-ribbon protein